MFTKMDNSKLSKIEANLKKYFIRNRKQAKQGFKHNMKLIDLNCYLLDNGLSILDKCTMASSVEGRVPYLDHKILEYVFDGNNTTNNQEDYNTSKKVLRDFIKNSKISYLAKRNKQGFNMSMNDILAKENNKK